MKAAVGGSKGAQKRRAMKARKRAGKWTDRDRDLAEREMAVVIVERQKVRAASSAKLARCPWVAEAAPAAAAA